MLTFPLHTEAGDKLTLQVKTGWEDVTVSEYINMQGKNETELLQLLTGLTPEQLAALEPETAMVFADLLLGFSKLPEGKCSINVESETVGQFETAKSELKRLYAENPATARAKALPVIYGLYMAPKQKGKWYYPNSKELTAKALEMPASEVVPVALSLIEQIEKLEATYQERFKDEDNNTDEAGEDIMEPFGYYVWLHLLSGGDILKHETIMQRSVRKIYTHLFFLNQLAKSQKQETVNG